MPAEAFPDDPRHGFRFALELRTILWDLGHSYDGGIRVVLSGAIGISHNIIALVVPNPRINVSVTDICYKVEKEN